MGMFDPPSREDRENSGSAPDPSCLDILSCLCCPVVTLVQAIAKCYNSCCPSTLFQEKEPLIRRNAAVMSSTAPDKGPATIAPSNE